MACIKHGYNEMKQQLKVTGMRKIGLSIVTCNYIQYLVHIKQNTIARSLCIVVLVPPQEVLDFGKRFLDGVEIG
jgi:hypothetical protein